MILKNKIGENHLTSVELNPNTNKKSNYAIKDLKISQFRNYENLELKLTSDPIILYGSNGSGKTNILEAISFLSPGRGLRKAKKIDIFPKYLNKLEIQNTAWGINANVQTPDGLVNVGSGYSIEKNIRTVKIDSATTNQCELSNIFKISWITPQMLLLFHTSMSEKRRFVDRLVNYLDPNHVSYLYKFEKLIRERSKIITELRKEELWLETLEMNIVNLAILIMQNRNVLISEINKINADQKDRPSMDKNFPLIEIILEGETEEWFKKEGKVEFKKKLLNVLKQNRKNNIIFFPGPHKSVFSLKNIETNKEINFCSTGEQKIMLISLILIHSKLLEVFYNSPPILLLDDIVEHLDCNHKNAIFNVTSKYKSQCWFTATDFKYFDTYPGSINTISVDGLNKKLNFNKELVYA